MLKCIKINIIHESMALKKNRVNKETQLYLYLPTSKSKLSQEHKNN